MTHPPRHEVPNLCSKNGGGFGWLNAKEADALCRPGSNPAWEQLRLAPKFLHILEQSPQCVSCCWIASHGQIHRILRTLTIEGQLVQKRYTSQTNALV